VCVNYTAENALGFMRPYSPHKCLWKIKSKGFWYCL